MKNFSEEVLVLTKDFNQKLELQYPYGSLHKTHTAYKSLEHTVLDFLTSFNLVFKNFLKSQYDGNPFFKDSHFILKQFKPLKEMSSLEYSPFPDDELESLAYKYIYLDLRQGYKMIVQNNPYLLETAGKNFFEMALPIALWSEVLESIDQNSEDAKLIFIEHLNSIYSRLMDIGQIIEKSHP